MNEKRTLTPSEDKLNQLKQAYEHYLSKEVCKLMLTITEERKKSIFTAFEKHLGSGGYLDLFRKEGLDNVLVSDRFSAFVQFQYPEVMNAIMSFDEYLKKLSASV